MLKVKPEVKKDHIPSEELGPEVAPDQKTTSYAYEFTTGLATPDIQRAVESLCREQPLAISVIFFRGPDRGGHAKVTGLLPLEPAEVETRLGEEAKKSDIGDALTRLLYRCDAVGDKEFHSHYEALLHMCAYALFNGQRPVAVMCTTEEDADNYRTAVAELSAAMGETFNSNAEKMFCGVGFEVAPVGTLSGKSLFCFSAVGSNKDDTRVIWAVDVVQQENPQP